jgi:hypothetical protein
MFADHMGSIALLATDAATRKAAENRLALERKLRPTDEERAAKLAELASDALARREANKARLEGISTVREATEVAAKERARNEKRQRNADKALAIALSPLGPPKPRAAPMLGAAEEDGASEEIEILEKAVIEAREAGNGSQKGSAAERLRVAEVRLAQLKAGISGGTGPMAPLGFSDSPSHRDQSHRSPGQPKESDIDRKLRRQKLAGIKR